MKATEVRLIHKRKGNGIKITCSRDAEEVLRNFWDMDTMDYCESFVTVYLSRGNEVLGIMKVTEGGLDSCIVDHIGDCDDRWNIIKDESVVRHLTLLSQIIYAIALNEFRSVTASQCEVCSNRCP